MAVCLLPSSSPESLPIRLGTVPHNVMPPPLRGPVSVVPSMVGPLVLVFCTWLPVSCLGAFFLVLLLLVQPVMMMPVLVQLFLLPGLLTSVLVRDLAS